jgi:uncharacterized protein
MTPTQSSERIDTIDVLRGFALLGILVVNILYFSAPHNAWDVLWNTPADHLGLTLVLFLADEKFYPIFSFLFGLGFMLQMSSVERRGGNFVPFFRRRLAMLLLIGAVHALFFSYIDILVIYALLGFLLLFFRNSKPSALLGGALLSLLMAMGMRFLFARLQAEALIAEIAPHWSYTVVAYRYGTLDMIFAQHLRDLLIYYIEMVQHIIFKLFALFLLGAWAGKLGIFRNIPRYRHYFQLAMWLGLAIGLPGNMLYALDQTTWNIVLPLPAGDILMRMYFVVSDLALTCFYISAITLLHERVPWQRVLAPLATVGRMALTNYVLQSVICTLLFYSYGLGLYALLGPGITFPLAFLIYGLQVLASALWLRHYRAGPLEWVWRSLTYKKLLPLRRTPPAQAITPKDSSATGESSIS